MTAREIARGGLLAATAFVLLYFGGISPYAAVAACIAAGATSAVPLIRHARVKLAVVLYCAVSVLALLLVPRKSLAAAYILVCGLYPIVKFGIECYLPPRMQMLCKFAYCNAVLLVAWLLVRYGLFPRMRTNGMLPIVVWGGANIVFALYDIGLSRLIAALRGILPKD